MKARRRGLVGSEEGAATAELALALPVLMSVTVGMVWLLSVGAAQVRTVDAAREVARAVARGDDRGPALSLGRRIAPAGVRFSVEESAGLVLVRAEGRFPGPGGLFAHLPGAHLRADATAWLEDP